MAAPVVAILAGPLVSNLIRNILNPAASFIKEEFLLVHGFKENVEKLIFKLTFIETILGSAMEMTSRDPFLTVWFEKLQDAVLDAEDTLETLEVEAFMCNRKHQQLQHKRIFQISSSVSRGRCQYNAAKKIKAILAKLDEIAKVKQEFHVNIVDNRRRNTDPPFPSFSRVDTSSVFGREEEKEKIIQDLLRLDQSNVEENISVIPIVGMGGLGKTTLAQQVFNDQRVVSHFELSRMWVWVTVNFQFDRILRQTLESYTKQTVDSNLSHENLEFRFQELMLGKRFLLVLDDVWTEDYTNHWSRLLQLLKLGKKGSKVLVTCRSQRIAKLLGVPSYNLEDLPENECWSLFKKFAFHDCCERKDLEDIGREIVRRCSGLPLAVKALAGALRGEDDIRKWKNVLNDETWKMDDAESKIFAPLKMSYDFLPSHLKLCFAYCSIFPKAHVYNREDMVKFWMAQKFIQPRHRQTLEEIGEDYFDQLLARSFFHLSIINNKVHYGMHDLIHDLAERVSGNYCSQVWDIKSHIFSKTCRHLSLRCQVEQHASQLVKNTENLRTLLLPGQLWTNFDKSLDKMFHKWKYLRTLDLSSSTLLKLPNSIEELKLLQYLDLSNTEVKVLPDFICKLCNLQTLKLLRCLWLFKLPKDLRNLVNLHHLELDNMFWFKFPVLPPRMGNLTNLQNLQAFRVGRESGYGIEELKGMAHLGGTLHLVMLENAVNAKEAELNKKENLQKLVFEWSDRDTNPQDEVAQENVLEDLQPPPYLKVLQICNYKGSRFPTWMSNEALLHKLVSVTLTDCTGCKILTIGKLPLLQELNIKGLHQLEEWPNVLYPSLYRLKISHCTKLNKLPNIFPNLGVLKIKNCSALTALPIAPLLKFLILVDNPNLENWNEVTVHFRSTSDEGHQKAVEGLAGEKEGQCQCRCWVQGSLLNLLELTMVRCSKLSALPQQFAPQKLVINGCELLKELPRPEFARRFQHLALHACNDGTLTRAIPNTSSMYSLVISDIANLVSLPKWPELPDLKVLYVQSCKDLVSLSNEEGPLRSLSSLKSLFIQDCPNLVTLIKEELPSGLECLSIRNCPRLQSLGPNRILKSLPSLSDLYIEDCPLLHSFPEDGLPTSLKHLSIQGCPELIKQCKNEGTEWPKIMHIPDLEIDFTM